MLFKTPILEELGAGSRVKARGRARASVFIYPDDPETEIYKLVLIRLFSPLLCLL